MLEFSAFPWWRDAPPNSATIEPRHVWCGTFIKISASFDGSPMKSTGRFTTELRRLIHHSYDICRHCGLRMEKDTAALAGYDSSGSPAYVGPCCEFILTERASHIYWEWHADYRCSPAQKLWRYMDLAKFISLLEDGALYFARADKLGDPFEGAAGISARKHVWEKSAKAHFRQAILTAPAGGAQLSTDEVEQNVERLLGEMRHAMEHERLRTYASCWHANTGESEALWRLYCPPPQAGLVIQTTAEALETSLGPDVAPKIGHVRYIDFGTTFAPTYDRIFTKRKSLSHEAEVRAVFEQIPMKDPPPGLLRPVDVKQLVHLVAPSPFAPPWLHGLIEKILKRHNIIIPVRPSELLGEPFF